MRMTEEKFFEIKRVCNTAIGLNLWDFRTLVDEVEHLRECLVMIEQTTNEGHTLDLVMSVLKWKKKSG